MLLAIVALTTYFHANCVNISIYTKYATCMPDWVSDILSFIFIKQSNQFNVSHTIRLKANIYFFDREVKL